MSLPRIDTLRHFEHFLLAYVSTLLYLRSIYPRTIFLKAGFHNTSVSQSRSPELCSWIMKAVEAACTQLLKSKVARMGIDICTERDEHVERYVFDVCKFNMVDWNKEKAVDVEERDPLSPISPVSAHTASSHTPEHFKPCISRPLDEDTPIDLSEQLRATLIQLKNRCELLAPLPPQCSFNIFVEPGSNEEVQLLTQEPNPWVSAQPYGTEAEQYDTCTDDVVDSRGIRKIPVHSVRYPDINFEAWIEIFPVHRNIDNRSMSSPLFPGRFE
jgi:mitotic spindle assembly checkpoint protein MAD2B